jgi:hypothetical protein
VNVGRVRAVRLGRTKYADRMAIKGTEIEIVVVGGGLLIHVSAICSQCGGRWAGAAWRLYQRLAITGRSDGEWMNGYSIQVCSGCDDDGETSIGDGTNSVRVL